MNKYTNVVTEINPMETAPVWDYYNGNVEVVILFFLNYDDVPANITGYYNREEKVWKDFYSDSVIYEELLGWLPDYTYVSPN